METIFKQRQCTFEPKALAAIWTGQISLKPIRAIHIAKLFSCRVSLQESTFNFTEVLRRRKSVRSFSLQPLSKVDLAFLLWASTGIQRIEHGYEFRTAPSAGALYPIETYLAANNVEDLSEGIYHYNIKNHLLEEIKLGNFGGKLAHAALDQEMCADASVVFIWTAVFERSKWKYSAESLPIHLFRCGTRSAKFGVSFNKHQLWIMPSRGFL